MSQIRNTRDEILDAAESMMRTAGYHAFSTRDVPASVDIKAASARTFFERNLDWLTAALNNHGKRGIPAALNRATLVLASLEGAMILSKSLADQAVFERVVKGLLPTPEKLT